MSKFNLADLMEVDPVHDTANREKYKVEPAHTLRPASP